MGKLRKILIVICAVVFIVSAYFVIRDVLKAKRAKDTETDLKDLYYGIVLTDQSLS